MIQDIAPKRFQNEFVNREVTREDYVVLFQGKNVLLRRKEDGSLQLPVYGDLVRHNPQKAGEEKKAFQYGFSIDGKGYYIRKIFEKEGGWELPGYTYEKVSLLRQLLSKDVCFSVMCAYHLYVWYESNQYCGRCGRPVVHDTRERMVKCPVCGNMIYPKIAPAVIVGVVDKDRILMSKYADREYKKYALIAGFTEFGETAEETVVREVMEEVGLRVNHIKYYKSQPWGVDSNLLLGYFATLDGADTIHMDERELAKAEWFSREVMPAHDDGISLTREMMGFFQNKEAFSSWYGNS